MNDPASALSAQVKTAFSRPSGLTLDKEVRVVMEENETITDAGVIAADEELDYEQLVALYDESMRHLEEGQIVTGNVVEITSGEVVVDVGYKSEGLIPLQEFTDASGEVKVEVGDEVEVLLEKTEDLEGHVLLSKIKAERMRIWRDIENAYKEGLIINGRVIDRIKGGLTVDVGLRAFLPGSLVDIKPVKHLESLRGEELEFKVISLDRRRNNIVLSRKAVLEKDYEKKTKDMGRMRKALFDMLPKGREIDHQIPLKDRTLSEIINLESIDLKVKKGSFVVIVGETGCGKSSLLNRMAGRRVSIVEPTAGVTRDRVTTPLTLWRSRGISRGLRE